MVAAATCWAGLCDFSSLGPRVFVLGVLGELLVSGNSGWRRLMVPGVPAAPRAALVLGDWDGLLAKSSSKLMPAFWASVSRHLSGRWGSSLVMGVPFTSALVLLPSAAVVMGAGEGGGVRRVVVDSLSVTAIKRAQRRKL